MAITQPRALSSAYGWWKDEAARTGRVTATRALIRSLWAFVLDSTPSRRRQRYGDAEYDWDHKVNTTSGAVGWRERLIGVFHSAYQPTEPALFREILDTLQQHECLDLSLFTFVDLGSGKGRTLMMASDYPFRRIVGVELLPALNAIAKENLGKYKGDSQRCFQVESMCADATTVSLPEDPLLIYLFHPFQEEGLGRFLENLKRSVEEHPRRIYVAYHNPLLEPVLVQGGLRKICGTHQYSLFAVRW